MTYLNDCSRNIYLIKLWSVCSAILKGINHWFYNIAHTFFNYDQLHRASRLFVIISIIAHPSPSLASTSGPHQYQCSPHNQKSGDSLLLTPLWILNKMDILSEKKGICMKLAKPILSCFSRKAAFWRQ